MKRDTGHCQCCFIFPCWQGFIFFLPAYPLRLADLARTEAASGRCDMEHVSVSQESWRQRENLTPTDCQRPASVWKGEHVWHHMWAHGKERQLPLLWEIKPGHSIQQKTLISLFDKNRIEALFQYKPPPEKNHRGNLYSSLTRQVQTTFLWQKHTDFYNLLPLPAVLILQISK